MLVVVSFIVVKILVYKLLFKPYRIAEFLSQSKMSLNNQFRDNCIVMGYTLIGLTTELIYDHLRMMLRDIYKTEAVLLTKQLVFQDLLLKNDGSCGYHQFDFLLDRADWKQLVGRLRTFITLVIQAVDTYAVNEVKLTNEISIK